MSVGRALPWIFASIGCWVAYELVRQNGRILLRLEALESRLAAASRPSGADLESLQQGLEVGTDAPTFELPALDGRTVSLDELVGSPVALVFFSPSCGFCQQIAGDIALASRTRAPGEPRLVVISSGSPEENRDMVERNGFHCPVLLQPGNEVGSRYRVGGTPMAYLIDENGKIASGIAVGGPAVVALIGAEGSGSVPVRWDEMPAHREHRGNKPLEASRLLRTGLPPGTPAPSVRLPTLDGDEFDLDRYRGQRVLLVFSDPTCGPCNLLAPRLEDLHRASTDLRVVMISRGDVDANRRKAREHGLTFPIALQRHWEVSRDFGMFATPVAYLIDERGVIAAGVASGPEQIVALASAPSAKGKEAMPIA